jgi:hypothetical protein
MLNPRLDGTFKAIFTQDTDDSRNALKSFLSAMIGRTVTKVTVRENEPAENFEGQKGIRYDINCIFDNSTRAQVEIQGLNRKYDYGKRAEYYVARLVSSIFKEADNPKRQKLIGELVKTDGGIMCAEKTLDKISEDGWRWFDEAYNQSFRIDQVSSMNACRREGRKEGIEVGKNTTKIANARNLIAMKILSYEQIAQAVELPIEKIEELAREMEAAIPATK